MCPLRLPCLPHEHGGQTVLPDIVIRPERDNDHAAENQIHTGRHRLDDGNNIIADLRYMSEGSHQAFQQIVRGGIFSGLGMASFAAELTEAGTAANSLGGEAHTLRGFGGKGLNRRLAEGINGA